MANYTKNLEFLDYLGITAGLLTIATLLTTVLYYREMASRRLVTFWAWLLQSIYSLNPYLLWQSDDFWKRCVLWYCAIRFRFSIDDTERDKLLQWATSKIRGVPKPINFTTSWKDGIALCALMEDLSPGSCPRYDLLNSEHCQSNVHLALKMAQRHLKMKPSISVKEMVECLPSGERKLICLVAQLKKTENLKPGNSTSINDAGLPMIRIPGDGERSFGLDRECVAKGMGLMLAVKGRRATFNIFLKTSTNLNIVIEIKGPSNSIASERITSRSPKRKTPIKQGTPVLEASTLFRSGDIRRSISMSSENENDGGEGPVKIPFEYEVQHGQISVGYIPKETGKHRLSIINEGQHIMGSPYTITVDDSCDMSVETKSKMNKKLMMSHKLGDSFEMDTPPNSPTTETLKPNFNLQTSPALRSSLSSSSKKLGMVTKRRVLRHILTIDGREVVVEDADAEHLGMAVQALKEVEDSNPEEVFQPYKNPNNSKMLRQNSIDDASKDPEVVYRHALCPVHEDKDLKDVRSASPKKEVDCGPIFTDRPRAVSYTESEISSLDGIDTGGIINADAFKWNVAPEVPDTNQNYDAIKNLNSIPRLEITDEVGEELQVENQEERDISNVTPVPESLLDVNFSNDETDSISPELAHPFEATPHNGIGDNYDEAHFDQHERQLGSSTGGSESDEWLVVSMDTKTKEHSLEISDQRVPVEGNTPSHEAIKDTSNAVTEEALISLEVQDVFESNYEPEVQDVVESNYEPEVQEVVESNYMPEVQEVVESNYMPEVQEVVESNYMPEVQEIIESNYKPEEQEAIESNYKSEEPEEYHSMEEYESPVHESSNPTSIPEMDKPPPIPPRETKPGIVLESVTDRKQFFENLFIQTNSKNSSPVNSPVKSSSFSPRASLSNKSTITTSYSVDESLSSCVKRKLLREPSKSQSLCSLGDDTVDTSPTFLKARSFWERGNLTTESDQGGSKESLPAVSTKTSPVEEEIGASIRQKLDFWQTLTTPTTTPDQDIPPPLPPPIPPRGDRGHRKKSDDGGDGTNRTNEMIVKDSRETLLESPGSEDTRDSGVFISWTKLNENPDTQTNRFGGLGRTLSDPGTTEDKVRDLTTMDSSNTLPLSKSFVYRHNPIFSLDIEGGFERYNDFDSQTEESNGLNETMSDDRGYIDDEIPDYASIMMDRYISFTGLLDNDRLLSRNELVGLGIEGIMGNCYGGESPTKDSDKTLLLPQSGKCRAYGAGVYYGQVGVRNQFQVCTQGAGKGCLTVSVQGPGDHDVAEVVVSYIGDHSYEVMYEVLEPGYYIICIKWSEWNIPESPFICKVTY